jgi:hypothetical protein
MYASVEFYGYTANQFASDLYQPCYQQNISRMLKKGMERIFKYLNLQD